MEFLGSYSDHLVNPEANDLLAEFVRDKIRAIVHDPATAEALCPTTLPIGTKRLCVDTSYYETFNLPHVRLVDLRAHPISTITETGIDLVRRDPRLRRHRLRHGLRRDDGRHRRRRHRGPRRPQPQGGVGRTAPPPTSG